MTYGYGNSKPDLQKRLNRIEGQVRGVAKMITEDRYCIEILTQISAAQAALDKVALELLRDHAKHCLHNDAVSAKGMENKAEELVGAISRIITR